MNNSSDLDQLRRPGWIATGAAPVFAAAAGYAATVDMELSWLLITFCLVSALCFGIVGIWTLILVGQLEASEDRRRRQGQPMDRTDL